MNNRLLDEALKLPDDERAALAINLMESLEQFYFDVDDALAADIERRVEEIRSGRAQTVPWDVARQMIAGGSNGPHTD